MLKTKFYRTVKWPDWKSLKSDISLILNLGQPIGKIEVMCITVRFICEKALEIASGLEFLAQQNVVHGDLAARIGFPFDFSGAWLKFWFSFELNPNFRSLYPFLCAFIPTFKDLAQ